MRSKIGSRWFRLAPLAIALSACALPQPARPQHPAYLRALSELRAARWLIDQRLLESAHRTDAIEAIHQIDASIGDLKEAADDDGKDLHDHPPVDERADQSGRIHEILRLLTKSRADISSEEDDSFSQGWRHRATAHIDAAIAAARRFVE